ncbi:unnamed protein product [Rotaria sordida]|uniref:Uncharacterized protein n=1 Tax=Rotaria sordida TaxID=392033 RepID=A0A819NFX2_9BILA|nr:unnamed protein product [Rotaria sordida]
MIGVLVNPNSVYVPCVQSGCCKIEFDLTYPIHLNGIISKDEFRESINKIYKTFSSYKNIIIAYSIIFALGIVFGMATCIVAITMPSKYSTVFPVLLSLGILLTIFEPLVFIIGFPVVYSKRRVRLRQAIP